MKNLITILIMLVAAGCSKQAKTEDSVDGKYVHTLVVLPAREEIILRKDKVYEMKYFDREGKLVPPMPDSITLGIGRWEVINREVVATSQNETHDGFFTQFFRIEANGDLIKVAGGWTKQDGKVERKDRFSKGFDKYKKVK